jgi:MFS family permease
MAELVVGPSVRDRQARIAVSAAYAVQGLCFAGVVTQVPAIKERFDLGELHLSLILLAVPVIAGVGSVLAGVLAPRIGSATVLRVAALGVCLGLALDGLAPSLAALYPAVGFFGLAVGAVDATMNMQGVAVQARYGRTILNSFHAWWSVAGIAAALITSGTGAWHWPLAAATGLVAGLGAVVVAVAGPRLVTKSEESAATAAQPHPSGVVPMIRWWPVVLVGCAVMVMYIGESSVSLWSGVLLKDTLLASAAVVPLGWAAYLGFQLVGRVAADRVVGRFGVVGTVAAGGLVGAVGFGLTVVAQTPLLGIVGFAIVGAGLCVVVPMAFSTAGALDPTGTGVVIARVNLFNYAGFVVGSALIGVIGESVGVRLAFGVPAALALLIIPLAFAFRPAEAFRSVAAAGEPDLSARAMAAE